MFRPTLLLMLCAFAPACLLAQASSTPFGQRVQENAFAPTTTTIVTTIPDPAGNTQWQSVWQNPDGIRSIYHFSRDNTYTESGANTQSGTWTLSSPTSTAAVATLVLTPAIQGAAKVFDISMDGNFLTQDNGLRWSKLGSNASVPATAPAAASKSRFEGTRWLPQPGTGTTTEIEFRTGQLALIITNTVTPTATIPTAKEFVAWKELSEGLVEITHANGAQSIHILNPDHTLSKTASAEQWLLDKSIETASPPSGADNTEFAKATPLPEEEQKVDSPFIIELNQLLAQYKSAMSDAARLQNNQDKSALESLQRRANQSGNIELALKVQDALEAVKENAPFNFITEYDTPEKIRKARPTAATDAKVRAELELIELKEKRDRVILNLSKTVTQRFKAPFDTLLRRAMNANDLVAAKAIKAEQDAIVSNFDDMQKSDFLGKRWTWLTDGTPQGYVQFLGNGSLSAPPALRLTRWQTQPDGTIKVFRANDTYFVFKLNETKAEANTLDELGTVVDTIKTIRTLRDSSPQQQRRPPR